MKKTILTCAILGALTLSSSAHADFFFATEGTNGEVSLHDTNTSLSWLTVNATSGFSYADVLNSDYFTDNWRIATSNEVFGLANSFISEFFPNSPSFDGYFLGSPSAGLGFFESFG